MNIGFPRKILIALMLVFGLAPISGCASLSAATTTIDPDKETVVLLHGLGRSPSAMWRLAGQLEDAGYEVIRIGYDSFQDTPKEILADIEGQLDAYELDQSTKVHFVGHSFGGLVIRDYLAENQIPSLGHVVLMGTPNKGTAIVDNLRDKWWFNLLGPTARELGTGKESYPQTLKRPNYPLGVIAGKTDSSNDHLLPGPDDGMVSVESAKLEGMTDFILVETGHSAMRYDKNVSDYTINFLKNGRFVINQSHIMN